MGKRAGPLSEISADAADISASGLEYSHVNTAPRPVTVTCLPG